MDRVKNYPRKCVLTSFTTVISIFLLSTQVLASPTDVLKAENQEVEFLSGDEEVNDGKLDRSHLLAYSDAAMEEKTNSGTQETMQLQRKREFLKYNSFSINVGQTSMLDLDHTLDKVVGTECALWIFGCVYDRDIIEPLPIKFESTPSLAWSIEYERHKRGLWSYGGEYYRSIHKYTAASLTPTDGELEINRMFFAIKKYFEIGPSLQSYIGVSGGVLHAEMRGAIASSYNDGGTGWGGVIGAVYKTDSVNFKLSYRYSESSIHITDTFINDGLRRKTYGDISTRSSGYFAGIEVRF